MPHTFPCSTVQDDPRVVVAVIPGPWLLKRTTPSWRIKDPEKGFQRMVKDERARAIAAAVLDQHRSFPNAIVLATDVDAIDVEDGTLTLPNKICFLIVDGQHRLWAQKHSEFEGAYTCLIHFGLEEKEMAELFIEINDNQKRVPSSLRWDLVRLVRPEDDPVGVRTSDLVYDLATTEESPLYQRIDLTGEQHAISLKQGSVAPAIKGLVSARSPLHEVGYEIQFKVIINFVAAMRECDADGWDNATSPLYSARVFRAVFRLLPDLLEDLDKEPKKVTAKDLQDYLDKIDLETLDLEEIRAQQGGAGIRQIYLTIHEQVLG